LSAGPRLPVWKMARWAGMLSAGVAGSMVWSFPPNAEHGSGREHGLEAEGISRGIGLFGSAGRVCGVDGMTQRPCIT